MEDRNQTVNNGRLWGVRFCFLISVINSLKKYSVININTTTNKVESLKEENS